MVTTPMLILNATAEIVLAGGVEAVRVDQVAAMAGVNKRMIYHHYGDKERLLVALYRQQLAVLESSEVALSGSSVQLLQGLFTRQFGAPSLVPIATDNDKISGQQACEALQILLPRLTGDNLPDGQVVSEEVFAGFALEVGGLLFPAVARGALRVTPGEADFLSQCKRLLTRRSSARKPVYRITSVSRQHDADSA